MANTLPQQTLLVGLIRSAVILGVSDPHEKYKVSDCRIVKSDLKLFKAGQGKNKICPP